MLMIGRLMFGNRSIGSRPSATKPRMVTASENISTAIELRRARNVSHMLLLHLRPDPQALSRQLLALDDDQLVAGEAPRDLDERAFAGAGRHRPAAHDPVGHH